jgi:hypothetical protein
MRMPGANIGCRLDRTSGLNPVVPAQGFTSTHHTITGSRPLAGRIQRGRTAIPRTLLTREAAFFSCDDQRRVSFIRADRVRLVIGSLILGGATGVLNTGD